MKKLSQRFNLNNDTAVYAFAVAIALVIASALLVTYYVALRPVQEKYATIYLLDTNRKAADYPEYLVAGVNNTFSVYVEVENHMGRALENVEVLVKVTKDLNPKFPVDANITETFTGSVAEGITWENIATLTLNEPGNYSVYFELWIPEENGPPQFSNNFCVLKVQVAV
jgi:uncharacterized membrane protein